MVGRLRIWLGPDRRGAATLRFAEAFAGYEKLEQFLSAHRRFLEEVTDCGDLFATVRASKEGVSRKEKEDDGRTGNKPHC